MFSIPANQITDIISSLDNLVYLPKISKTEIEAYIKKITKNNFSSGPDLVPNLIIKNCYKPFSKTLFVIFNLAIKTNTSPFTT